MKNKIDILRVNEIFFSIQGESTQAGRPCVFVRLTYCNLRCSYCDTTYAFYEGSEMTIADIIRRIGEYGCRLVEITGGEPLVQENVHILMDRLCDEGFEVMIETGGHMDVSRVNSRVRKIMDVKCPSSGESAKVRWENLGHLNAADEIKFVIGDENDYDWARTVIAEHNLTGRWTVLFSPVFDKMDYRDLAERIMRDRLPVRMQLQLHKFIWASGMRGV